MNALELKQKTTKELLNIAEEHGLKHVSRQKKADIIFNILKTISKDGKELLGGGILETLPDGFGFLRSPWGSYLAGPDDVYVSPSQIRKFNLRTGDFVIGNIRPPREQERYFALVQVESINDNEPSKTQEKIEKEEILKQKKAGFQQLVLLMVGSLLMLLIGFYAPPSFMQHFIVFVLSCFVGFQVIWTVSHSLHTPLMAVTNAISGIIIVGALLQIGSSNYIVNILAITSVTIATINIVGGFLVTKRMLSMFKKS